MKVSRPPELLAACAVAGLVAFAFNVRGPVSVPCWVAVVLRRARRGVLGCTLVVFFGLVHAAAPLLANGRTPAAARPHVTRVATPSGEATRFEGTAAPGHRIIIRVNDRYAAETNADTDGRWRLQLPKRLPPGDHTATAVAVAPGSVRVRVSDEFRISIPQPAIPRYARNEAEKQEIASDSEAALPNAATRKLAAELARDASREFSELTAPELEAEEPAAAEPTDEAAGSDVPEAFALRDLLLPDRWFEAVAAWLTRSSRDYNEILVTGLSDPQHRLRAGAERAEVPADTTPPLPDRPLPEHSRIGNVLTSAVTWLERASREYQYVVQELALRGIENPEERQAARAAASAKQQASAAAEGETKSEPARPKQDRATVDERVATERRLADERRAAEKLRADEERQAAEERAHRRAAEEAEARARQLAEARSREREQQRQRELEEKQTEEKSIASALEDHLKERDQQSRVARSQQQGPDVAAKSDAPPTHPGSAEPPATQAPAETATKPAASPTAISEADPAKSAGTAAKVPLPPRMAHTKQTGPAIELPSRNVRRIARLPEKATQPPLPSRAWAKPRNPPLPSRALIMPADPPLPERLQRAASFAASNTEQRAGRADQGRRMALPVRRPEHHGRRARNRHRWCKDPAAGRAIRTPGTYIVAYGDTLWDIAERHYGAGHFYRRIHRANGRKIARANRIYPCQRLWLPRSGRSRR